MNFLPLVGAGLGIASSLFGASKASKAAKKAAAQQAAGIEKGLGDSEPLYGSAQGYLSPYVDLGSDSGGLLSDIIGLNGPDAQGNALAMYRSSPSASLLNDARSEAVRSTMGRYAAGGLSRSGALTQELARRTADMDLANYGNWENLSKGLLNTGANAASSASNLAMQRGSDILNARTGQGTARASGTIGSANAQLAGFQGVGNYLQGALGRMSGNDWGAGGGLAPSGSLPWQSNYSPLSAFMTGN